MEKIAIYCEFDYKKNTLSDVSYELISKAVELKKQALELKNEDFLIEAIVICEFLDDESIKKAYAAGANRVVLIKNSAFNIFNQITYKNAFLDYFKKNPSRIALFPATQTGRALAPRITTALDTGLVADCTEVEFIVKEDKLKLAPTRPTFGAELMATILSKKFPECATIRPGTFKISFDYSLNGEFVEYNCNAVEDNSIKLLKTLFETDKENEADFSNAKIVLTAGYGLLNGKNDEYVKKLQKLAKIIGAKFGATRKLVDFGVVEHSFQIGQTGTAVQAPLYIAFGVSGAIQHVCGMKNCKKIISINIDENAPIFNYSDYKIVTDAKNIIDELLNSFNK